MKNIMVKPEKGEIDFTDEAITPSGMPQGGPRPLTLNRYFYIKSIAVAG